MDKVEMYGLRQSFFPLTDFGPIEAPSDNLNLMDGRPFSHFLIVDISGEEFEAPSRFVNLAIQAKGKGYDRLYIPIFINSSYTRDISMAGTILNYFGGVSWQERLRGVKTSKGEFYYGMPGLLLDKNFRILFLTTVTVRVNGSSTTLVRAACRIPYEVFERQDELIPKTIYKKFIPMYAVSPIHKIEPLIGGGNVDFDQKADIIIGIGANVMFTPELPKPTTATDEEYHRIIKNNLTFLE